jgi:predicted transcriptional regulator
LQEANVEVKNVAEWSEELDEFFKGQKEASLLEEEKRKFDADCCVLVSVVEPVPALFCSRPES